MCGRGIIAVGPLHGNDLASVFASSDVFAFPSETETFGNVLAEAAASGLPAVVPGVGAAPEIVVDGVTGVVVKHSGPAPFAAAILSLIQHPERRRQMADAARGHARHYDLIAATHKTWQIYQRFLLGRPGCFGGQL
jgi:glycosyltransferase involved in cell wall biosynthesis